MSEMKTVDERKRPRPSAAMYKAWKQSLANNVYLVDKLKQEQPNAVSLPSIADLMTQIEAAYKDAVATPISPIPVQFTPASPTVHARDPSPRRAPAAPAPAPVQQSTNVPNSRGSSSHTTTNPSPTRSAQPISTLNPLGHARFEGIDDGDNISDNMSHLSMEGMHPFFICSVSVEDLLIFSYNSMILLISLE
jgi:hypothetical protein